MMRCFRSISSLYFFMLLLVLGASACFDSEVNKLMVSSGFEAGLNINPQLDTFPANQLASFEGQDYEQDLVGLVEDLKINRGDISGVYPQTVVMTMTNTSLNFRNFDFVRLILSSNTGGETVIATLDSISSTAATNTITLEPSTNSVAHILLDDTTGLQLKAEMTFRNQITTSFGTKVTASFLISGKVD